MATFFSSKFSGLICIFCLEVQLIIYRFVFQNQSEEELFITLHKSHIILTLLARDLWVYPKILFCTCELPRQRSASVSQ